MTETVQTTETEIPSDSPKEFIDRLLKEKKTVAEKNRQLASELDLMKSKIQEIEDQKLIEQKNFQALAEQRAKEANEWKERFTNSQQEIISAHKKSTLRSELLKIGMATESLDEILSFVDLNKISYDNETKIVIGADEYAKNLHQKFPKLFGVTGGARADHSIPVGTSGKLTLAEFKKLPLKEQKERQHELLKDLAGF